MIVSVSYPRSALQASHASIQIGLFRMEDRLIEVVEDFSLEIGGEFVEGGEELGREHRVFSE